MKSKKEPKNKEIEVIGEVAEDKSSSHWISSEDASLVEKEEEPQRFARVGQIIVFLVVIIVVVGAIIWASSLNFGQNPDPVPKNPQTSPEKESRGHPPKK